MLVTSLLIVSLFALLGSGVWIGLTLAVLKAKGMAVEPPSAALKADMQKVGETMVK